jgi:hypothetical protein
MTSFLKSPLFGFVALLLVGIPITMYLVGQQQHVQQNAAAPIKPTISYQIQSTLPTGDDGVHQYNGWTFSSNKYQWWIAARNDSSSDMQFTAWLDCIDSRCDSGTYAWPNTANPKVTATLKPKQVMYVTVQGRTCLDVQLDFTKPGPEAGRNLVEEQCTTTITPTKIPNTPTKIPPTPTKVPPTPTRTTLTVTPTRIPPTPTIAPSATPRLTPTPTPPGQGGPPTNTPTPTHTPIPTPTKTPVPTQTPVPTVIPTPTDIPPTVVIPTLTGPTSCPFPEKVQNIRIECPYCK